MTQLKDIKKDDINRLKKRLMKEYVNNNYINDSDGDNTLINIAKYTLHNYTDNEQELWLITANLLTEMGFDKFIHVIPELQTVLGYYYLTDIDLQYVKVVMGQHVALKNNNKKGVL